MTNLNSAKQQADDDLTWLARNVHKWSDIISGFPSCAEFSPPAIAAVVAGPKLKWRAFPPADGISSFTKGQWLTRRAELQNKPGWKDAPKWASWLGQCPSGKWEWYGDDEEPRPHKDMDCWDHQSLGEGSGKMGEVLGDWRNTLERRPQAAKPEPSSTNWRKRGELPPAGTECEVFVDGAWGPVFMVGFSRRGQPVIENRFGAVYECIDCLFRPMPTERDRVASELVDVMMAVPVSDRKTASESYMSMALAIYDHLHQESRV